MKGKNQILRVFQQLGALFALVLLSSSALAHTGLRTSNPADGAIVNHGPEELSLVFTADVALVRFNITDQTGKQLELDFKPSTDRRAEYHISLPAVTVGRFKVEWAAIGEDGHTVSNSFSYVVDPTAEASAGHQSGDQHGH